MKREVQKKLTEGFYKQQHEFWEDTFYYYSIHETIGGAVYLKQLDKVSAVEKEIRLDGVKYKKLVEKIEKYSD